MEQEAEEAVAASVTVISSDGDTGVLDVSEGKLVSVQEKYLSESKTFQIHVVRIMSKKFCHSNLTYFFLCTSSIHTASAVNLLDCFLVVQSECEVKHFRSEALYLHVQSQMLDRLTCQNQKTRRCPLW